ncbi:hypothetical protein FSY59_12695 [Comamonas sp. Z3]|uniref:hypothetical protein n=1 Tax=Comamonas sp. Z3 TaxID=2601247 RepID=UPI0011E80CDC|nr:hypothetical protein [Comamonas sp. Z3]TYK69405.1 hypothetical protein FSY59_18885 [Comamonas sp. Z3]TYK70414.1 hypothetical protein FSY59_12695 [Comamonas sp. Z3]
MARQRFVMHSELSVGRQGALAHSDKLLLRQGESDMACGHHCVLMALMLLGVVSRDALYEDEPDERLAEVCAIGQSRYFTGCSAAQLKEQFAPFAEQVHCRPLRRDVEARTIAALESDHVCLVRFTSPSYSHWVLAVGVMYVQDKPHSLLVLDPLMDGVPLTPWNALLEHWGSKKLRNTNARWSEKATMEKVVQVGLRVRRGKAIQLT